MKPRKNGNLTRIDDILKNSLGNLNLGSSFKVAPIWQAWSEIAGASIAQRSTPEFISGDTLVVGVTNSVWLYELTLQKKQLLAKVKARFPDITLNDIRFQIGQVKNDQS